MKTNVFRWLFRERERERIALAHVDIKCFVQKISFSMNGNLHILLITFFMKIMTRCENKTFLQSTLFVWSRKWLHEHTTYFKLSLWTFLFIFQWKIWTNQFTLLSCWLVSRHRHNLIIWTNIFAVLCEKLLVQPLVDAHTFFFTVLSPWLTHGHRSSVTTSTNTTDLFFCQLSFPLTIPLQTSLKHHIHNWLDAYPSSKFYTGISILQSYTTHTGNHQHAVMV